jgi:hypothetical protein
MLNQAAKPHIFFSIAPESIRGRSTLAKDAVFNGDFCYLEL